MSYHLALCLSNLPEKEVMQLGIRAYPSLTHRNTKAIPTIGQLTYNFSIRDIQALSELHSQAIDPIAQ